MASRFADRLRPLRPPNAPFSTISLPHALWLVIAATFAARAIPGANAYSWNLRSNPQQCQNMTIDLTGTGGQPPFRILIIPFGASPLPNNIEARKIQETVFATGSQRNGSVMLNYPANSQFVAVVSDASGFGTGGTSVAMQVESSSDSSCFNANENVSPDFVFSIEPPNQFVQCQNMRIWWDPSKVQGTPNFLGVIPGGQSFAIPEGQITQVPSQGTGFTWNTNVRGGTTLMLLGGDNRGNGTGGSALSLVSSGINNDSGCLGQNSPSSTAGNPAGMPTGSPGGGGGGGGSGSSGGSNTGAIVGGVVGGVALVICLGLALFFFRRRSRRHTGVKERPVDLLHGDDEDDEEDHRHNPNGQQQVQQQLDYYTPEPFMVPDPTLTSDAATTAATDMQSHSGWGASSSGRPLSGTSFTRSDTPDLHGAAGAGYGWAAGSTTTSTSRKGGPIRMRPVNIVQHEDAGPPPQMQDKEEEAETIELPPAYTAVQRPAIHGEDQPTSGMTDGAGPESRPPGAVPTADTTSLRRD